jgi:Domain of unknown function (DUF6398)
MPEQNSERVPQALRSIYDEVVAITDAVSAAHLNEEYAALARQMAAALARKRPSPLLGGKVAGWACGILYTLGRVNFLSDKASTPYLRMDEIGPLCGASKTTGPTKAKAIEAALNIRPYDPAWSLPSRLDSHPLAWLIQVNGLIVDARHVPRPIQEEALRKGLIPYIPGEGPAPGQ